VNAVTAGTAMTDAVRDVFRREVAAYLSVEMHPVERRLLNEVGTRWGAIRMLDLGIGAGRTTYTFAAICGSYTGIDVVTEMVERARLRFEASARVTLDVGDARSLPQFDAASFDVVLFSFNGIDGLDHEGRSQVLAEVRRLVKSDGVFVFSSHVLPAWPPPLTLPHVRWSDPIKAVRFRLGAMKQWLKTRYYNRHADGDAARAQGWVVLTEAHGFTLPQYYVAPVECVRQLHDAGFAVDHVFDFAANDLAPPYASSDPWLNYWCSPR
jgi:ubiquinone/menaquinone biosynthesis C-methylase UbiE